MWLQQYMQYNVDEEANNPLVNNWFVHISNRLILTITNKLEIKSKTFNLLKIFTISIDRISFMN